MEIRNDGKKSASESDEPNYPRSGLRQFTVTYLATLAAVLTVISISLGSYVIYEKRHQEKLAEQCRANLRAIDAAAELWAFKNEVVIGSPAPWSELVPFMQDLKDTDPTAFPCPTGAHYDVARVGRFSLCFSGLPGHRDYERFWDTPDRDGIF